MSARAAGTRAAPLRIKENVLPTLALPSPGREAARFTRRPVNALHRSSPTPRAVRRRQSISIVPAVRHKALTPGTVRGPGDVDAA
jgi:hypothetical protein